MRSLLFLDAGHSSARPGAYARGVDEQSINWVLCDRIKESLKHYPVTVIQTRADYFANPTLKQRVQEANVMDADMFISIHVNSATFPAYGTQVFHYGPSKTGNQLAIIMAEELHANTGYRTKVLGSPSASYKKVLYVLKRTKPWALLIEACYLHTDKGSRLLKLSAFPDAFTNGVRDGVLRGLRFLGKIK